MIIDEVVDQLQDALIDSIPTDDTARAGIVTQGALQGDPDPDTARIAVLVYENDPDRVYGKTGTGAMSMPWEDRVSIVECGGAVTWDRTFTVKARCLLVNTGEDKFEARNIASTVRKRIERAILKLDLTNVADDDEYVSQGIKQREVYGEMIQGGGPPDAYDYHIKVRFKVQTTITGVYS